MTPKFLICVAASLASLASAAELASGGAVFWLSRLEDADISNLGNGGAPTPPADGVIPQISQTTLRGGGTLYIWGQLDANKTLMNLSLNVTSSNPDVVKVTSSSVRQYNPALNKADGSSSQAHRWEYINEPIGAGQGASELRGLGGATILNSGIDIGVGAGPSGAGDVTTSPAHAPYKDTYYDRLKHVYLLASITYQFFGVGESKIGLSTGASGMNYGFWDGTKVVNELTTAFPAPRFGAVNIVVPPSPNPDFDDDGVVTGADFLRWQRGLGTRSGAQRYVGDANEDGRVDAADLIAWKAAAFSPSAAVAGRPAPEPLAIWTAAAAMAAVFTAARGRNNKFRDSLRRDAEVPCRRRLAAGRRWRALLWVGPVVATLSWQPRAEAVQYSRKAPGGGAFSTNLALWNPVGVPTGAADQVVFGLGQTSRYIVTGVGGTNSKLEVQKDLLTLDITSYTVTDLIVGDGLGVGDVILTGASPTLHTQQTVIGVGFSSSGVASAKGLSWTNDGSIYIGRQPSTPFVGTGTLVIDAVSNVTSSKGVIGSSTFSRGAVTVAGGSLWNAGELTVAESGATGTLTINGASTVSSTTGIVGLGAPAVGTVNVQGNGSTWSSSTDIRVGQQNGRGGVTISGGGKVMTPSGYIGDTSKGVVTVQDNDSAWINSTNLVVGNTINNKVAGDGQLIVKNGGRASSGGAAIIGSDSGVLGSVTIVGGGSSFQSVGLSVGDSGSGKLVVKDGAAASDASSSLGVNFFGAGEATIDGAHSSWDSTGDLKVGVLGQASLVVINGGAVSNLNGYVAQGPDSKGDAIVQGFDSIWKNNGRLGIGGDAVADIEGGKGSVAVQPGGEVRVGDKTIIFSTGVLRLQGGKIQSASLENRGVVELSPGGVLAAPGGVTNSAGGAITGNTGSGQIAGNVTNAGRMAPGDSPGIINIAGNYTQQSSGVLEIEVGGTNAGTDYDQLVVSGQAFLTGKLEVPLINGYTPVAGGPALTFLKSGGGVFGGFDSIFAPGLALLPPSHPTALRVIADPTNPNNRQLAFVLPMNNALTTGGAAVEWSSGSWTGGVPDTASVVSLQNTSASPRQINVASNNAFVHQLTVGGAGSTSGVALSIKDGKNLSAITGATVGSHGVVELDGGTLVSAAVKVQGGGELRGKGSIVGDVTLGVSGGIDKATLSPGLAPGAVGQMTIDGDYNQTSAGEMVIDIGSQISHDLVSITGNATLSGTLTIDLSADIPIANTIIPILTADNLTVGSVNFNANTGSTGLHAMPFFSKSKAYVALMDTSSGTPGGPGDLNYDIPVTPADAQFLAMALLDPAAYLAWYDNKFPDMPRDIPYLGPGNINGGSFNFDDIDAFITLLNAQQTPSGAPAPEPVSIQLVFTAALVLVRRR